MIATESVREIDARRGGRIVYFQYTNPAAYPPLEHSAELLAKAGMDVDLLGTAILAGALRFKSHPRIRVQLHRSQTRGWRQKLNYLSFALWTLAKVVRSRPDWIYASDPLACPIAFLATRLSRSRLIYHEHDSPDTSGQNAATTFMRVVFRARRAIGRRANVCILPNEQRAEAFARTVGRSDVLTVWNCPMRSDVGPARTAWGIDRLRVLYHGSIVPSRLPVAVLDALADLPISVSLRIAGYETPGHLGYVRLLLGRAHALGIADRVEYLGTVARRSDLMSQCAQCDVGLALLPGDSADLNEQTMFGASNKAFDYLACGLPVLVADLPAWRNGLVAPGYALPCDVSSASSITTALRWFLDHQKERVAMGERGRRRIMDEWNYETTFAPVMRKILAERQSLGIQEPENLGTTEPQNLGTPEPQNPPAAGL